jgi:N-acyl-D-amino-acid deacylase
VRTALELIARQSPSIVSFNMSEDDIAVIMRQPYTMTSSDGGLVAMGEGKPHPRNYGAFARKLSRYVRERGTITLEHAVRSMTSLPASVFGMRDRGMIREGAAADILVFDPAKVVERSTYTDPHHLADGMDYVLVNGQLVIADGRFTSALPGQVLRRR